MDDYATGWTQHPRKVPAFVVAIVPDEPEADHPISPGTVQLLALATWLANDLPFDMVKQITDLATLKQIEVASEHDLTAEQQPIEYALDAVIRLCEARIERRTAAETRKAEAIVTAVLGSISDQPTDEETIRRRAIDAVTAILAAAP